MAMTILAVSPNPDTLFLIEETLKDRYRVWGRYSLALARSLLEEGISPQLVVCPVILDKYSELTFDTAFDDYGVRHVPHIVYASIEERSVYASALQKATRVLTTPFSSLELSHAVDNSLPRFSPL